MKKFLCLLSLLAGARVYALSATNLTLTYDAYMKWTTTATSIVHGYPTQGRIVPANEAVADMLATLTTNVVYECKAKTYTVENYDFMDVMVYHLDACLIPTKVKKLK